MDRTTVTVQRVETSKPFTVTRAASHRHIISSADYQWLKQGPAVQPGGHLSTSLTCPEGSEKFLKSFRWARNVCCKLKWM